MLTAAVPPRPGEVGARATTRGEWLRGPPRGPVSGQTAAIFNRFVGTPAGGIDRFERLPDDLVAALRFFGEEFDEETLRAHPRVNVSDYTEPPARYRRETAERLAESERATIEPFYFWDPIPAALMSPYDEPNRRAGRTLHTRAAASSIDFRDAATQIAVLRHAVRSWPDARVRRTALRRRTPRRSARCARAAGPGGDMGSPALISPPISTRSRAGSGG